MYKTGSISVTNGSAIVTGAGTLWVDAGVLNAGDLIFCPDGTLQEVLSFQSNTQLMLAGDGHGNTVYLGATLAGQAYGIVPIGMLPSTLALRVKDTLVAAQAAIGSAVLSTAAQGLTATQQNNARANILALGASDVGKGLLSKSVAGGVAVTLTAAEASNQFIELTGALTASINLVVPAAARLFVIRNSTTGAYTVTVKTAAGTGVTVLQGGRMLIECDGTNCVDAMSFMRQTGGSIDGTPIGGTTPAAVNATTLLATTATSGPAAISGVTQANGVIRVASAGTTGVIDIGTNSGTPWIQATDRNNLATTYTLALNPNGGAVTTGGAVVSTTASSAIASSPLQAKSTAAQSYLLTGMLAGSAASDFMAYSGATSTQIGTETNKPLLFVTNNAVRATLGTSGDFSNTGSHTIGSFTVATRPAHAAGKMIYVSDGGAGAVFQGSNGSAWVNLG